MIGDDDGNGWSSLSQSSSDGGFDGGLGLCSFVGGWLFFGSGKVDCAVCVVVGWLFFGNGCELCRLWCFFVVVVCIILL